MTYISNFKDIIPIMQSVLSAYVEWSMEVLELCKEFKSRGVVAIDIACGDMEPGIEHQDMHTRAFQVNTSKVYKSYTVKNCY
jgi:hypothetical protein